MRLLHTSLVIAVMAASLATAGPVALADELEVVRTRDIEIPLSSGGTVLGDLFQPARNGQVLVDLPTIVTYFPYFKDDPSRFEVEAMERFVRAGFAGLLVDLPGTGRSPGEFGFLSEAEIDGGYDVVEWAAGQPFSDGRIGMWGYSYPGITTALVAARQPPHLEAIIPASAFSDAYRDVVYPGGALTSQDSGLALWLAFHAAVRARQDTPPEEAFLNTAEGLTNPWSDVILQPALHDRYDAWWQERAIENKVADIVAPALFWGGWHDLYPRGVPLNYLMAGSESKRLVMGPWGHIGALDGDSFEFFMDESIRWFDIFLRTPEADRADRLAAIPPVRVFDLDASSDHLYDATWRGEWRSFQSWPPAHHQEVLELCTAATSPGVEAPWLLQGALDDTCETEGAVPVATVADLTGPIGATHDTVKGEEANPLNDAKDQRLNLGATAFLGSPLEQAVTITGPLTAELHATSLGLDADWAVRLVDVGPDAATVMAQGWLRASHRSETPRTHAVTWHPHDGEDLLTPGEPYRMTVELWPTSYVVPAGHRIALLVHVADTLKVAPSGGAIANQVLVGPGHPSRLLLPVRSAQADPTEPVETPPDGGVRDAEGDLPSTGGGVAAAAAMIAVAAGWRRRQSCMPRPG